MTRKMTFATAINEAMQIAMEYDPKVLCFGLGVDDPKRIFGTTQRLQEQFGKERVFDTPTSENGMTGIGIGAALGGYKSVMSHQRLDFFLLAMDQLVNNAAKWYYMFGGQCPVPIVVRLILGRGWGQGPTHSQNLQAWFAHVPGLKVVMPTTPADAKGLLLESIFDLNPVVFLEHRWLHNAEGIVPEGDYRVPIGKAKLLIEGKDVTIVSMSYMSVEALKASHFLAEHGISCDLLDLRTIKPLDWSAVMDSVRKTGRLLVLDTGVATGSVAGEIIARVSLEIFDCLKQAPRRIAMPDNPEPTGFGLTKYLYPNSENIVEVVADMLHKRIDVSALVQLRGHHPHDVPGEWFKGPF